ncbi:MAG: hypothetical protein HYS22_07515 [Deltaproteobacteria bacterium]|nr:hypothetical protein [Deltaproteobacteria bacterium]
MGAPPAGPKKGEGLSIDLSALTPPDFLDGDLATRVGRELGVSIPPFSTVEATPDGGIEVHADSLRRKDTDPPGVRVDVYVRPDGSVTSKTTTDCADPSSFLQADLKPDFGIKSIHGCPDRETKREGPIDPAKVVRAREVILGKAQAETTPPPPPTPPTGPARK